MNQEEKQKMYDYIYRQIENADDRVARYSCDMSGKSYPKRNRFFDIEKYIDGFNKKSKKQSRLILLYGLRGTGKTTLLAQAYEAVPKAGEKRKLFISLDEVTGMFGKNLADVIEVYEDILGESFEALTKPVFLFIDEVHFDKNWARMLKILYERSDKIFIFATGSSALSLQTTPDLERRSVSIKMYPMQFTEYMKIQGGKYEEGMLGAEIRSALFESKNAVDVFTKMERCKTKVMKYWGKIQDKEKMIDSYIGYGTLPSTLTQDNEVVIYDQIKKTLDRIISVDIPQIKSFSSDIMRKIPSILYTISSSQQYTTSNIANTLDISRPVLMEVLEILEKTETIWRIYPYGSHHSQVRKPSRYLFTSPALRSMYFNLVESVSMREGYDGMLFEDTVGLVLRILFSEKPQTSITYDSAEGGADFIVRCGKKTLVIEVGYGAKDGRQVAQTMKRVGTVAYGIVISKEHLSVDEQKNIVYIPISYFLLV